MIFLVYDDAVTWFCLSLSTVLYVDIISEYVDDDDDDRLGNKYNNMMHLNITDRSFRYASRCLRPSFRQRHPDHSFSHPSHPNHFISLIITTVTVHHSYSFPL